MKTTFIILACMAFSKALIAQCPTAGRDTSDVYCRLQQFDVRDLRSADADTNGIFLDPAEDTMTNTITSLNFPGQYHFFYIVSDVSDTGCPRDSAEYTISIINCWAGISESVIESHALIKTNPVNNQLFLNESDYESLEIRDISGRTVLHFTEMPGNLIDVSTLESGNYILIAEKNGMKPFQRFIKQ